jgi:hypothetical protein
MVFTCRTNSYGSVDKMKQKNYARGVRNAAYVHGCYGSPTYRSWRAMLQRVYSPTYHARQDYERRGITVCDRWRNSFEAFLTDMGERPEGLTLERVENDKGYEPGNCQWATIKEQANNRCSSRLIEISGGGVPKTAAQWSYLSGTPSGVIRQRIDRDKWPPEHAIFGKPVFASACLSGIV